MKPTTTEQQDIANIAFLTDFDGLQGYDFINFPRLSLGALEVLFRSPSSLA